MYFSTYGCPIKNDEIQSDQSRKLLFILGKKAVICEELMRQRSLGFSSVWISLSVVSDSLRPHESQHARPPCPSPTPGVHSDSRPSSQ